MYKEITAHPLAAQIAARPNKNSVNGEYVKYKPEDCFLPKYFLGFYERIKNFEIRADDVWLTGFPKSGNK
jgi:hypothetical protein